MLLILFRSKLTARAGDDYSAMGDEMLAHARTQPGFHFGLNQRFFGFLVTNECAFVAFSAGDAPSMNGGALNAGLDMNLSIVNLSALVGGAGVNVIGGFEFGPAYTAKVRVPVTPTVQIFGLYTYTNITKYRVEDASGGHTGLGRRQAGANARHDGLSCRRVGSASVS